MLEWPDLVPLPSTKIAQCEQTLRTVSAVATRAVRLLRTGRNGDVDHRGSRRHGGTLS